MCSPRRGSLPRPFHGRRLAAWAALALGWLLPSTGCQVEYAGMTMPSGKYMHDDVQYFPTGPDFPWANTQAATQRARMQAMGMEVPPPGQGGPMAIIPGQGAISPVQNQFGQPTNINTQPPPPEPVPQPGAGAPVPPPPAPGDMPAPSPDAPAAPGGGVFPGNP